MFLIEAAEDQLEKKLNVIDSFAQEHEMASTKQCVISFPNPKWQPQWFNHHWHGNSLSVKDKEYFKQTF